MRYQLFIPDGSPYWYDSDFQRKAIAEIERVTKRKFTSEENQGTGIKLTPQQRTYLGVKFGSIILFQEMEND